MNNRKFWLFLTIVSTFCALVQLPFPPTRFGGIFALILAAGCGGEWLMLTYQELHPVCATLAVAGKILFSIFLISFAFIQIFIIQRGIYADPEAENADYILVLGALVNPNGAPSLTLAARCDTAADFLETHPNAKAILCGGQGPDEPRPEAESMYDYMIAKGIDAARLLQENQSNNTIANIKNAKQFLSPGQRVAIITSDYHLARARKLLAAAGLGSAGIPAPTSFPAQWPAVRTREYCSILGLMLSGRW